MRFLWFSYRVVVEISGRTDAPVSNSNVSTPGLENLNGYKLIRSCPVMDLKTVIKVIHYLAANDYTSQQTYTSLPRNKRLPRNTDVHYLALFLYTKFYVFYTTLCIFYATF